MDWIQGDKFKGLADFTYAPKLRANDDYDGLANTLNLSKVRQGNIIYTHMMYIPQLFEFIKDLQVGVKIISHNGDNAIKNDYMPECVIRWYSQNVAVKNERITSIPIGLENDRWKPYLHKKERMEAMTRTSKNKIRFAYINHCIKTNPGERAIVYDLFEKKPWVTAEHGINGKCFEEYIGNIYHHPFVFCPEGNGIDTHRTWETLYLGSIPIEKRNINNQFYTDLPICFVDKWEDVTIPFLMREYKRIKKGTWNYEMLTFEYWKKLIKL